MTGWLPELRYVKAGVALITKGGSVEIEPGFCDGHQKRPATIGQCRSHARCPLNFSNHAQLILLETCRLKRGNSGARLRQEKNQPDAFRAGWLNQKPLHEQPDNITSAQIVLSSELLTRRNGDSPAAEIIHEPPLIVWFVQQKKDTNDDSAAKDDGQSRAHNHSQHVSALI